MRQRLSDLGALVLRVGVGLVFFPHGMMKLNGGADKFAGFLTQLGVPLPMTFAWLVILLESLGAGLLILGLGTRLIALGLAVDMLVAVVRVKMGMMNAPLMGPNGSGYELELILGLSSLALALWGPGRWSVDAKLFK